MASGTINHAISVGRPVVTGRCTRPAAQIAAPTRGNQERASGLRFPPGLAMPSGLNPFAQMVFRAIQTYGMVVTDQSGGVQLEAEKQSSDWTAEGNTGPAPIATSWDGLQEYEVVAKSSPGQPASS